MSQVEAFRLPDLGEGLTEGEIVRWLVTVGQSVTVNEPIVEVETAKAAVEIPARWSGKVSAILHPAGETVSVGTPIIEIETTSSSDRECDPVEPGELAQARTPVLVGYGPQAARGTRRAASHRRGRQQPEAPEGSERRRSVEPAAGAATPGPATVAIPDPATPGPASSHVLAKPPVRKLARDLGVNLAAVAGTGPNGSVTRDDVEAVSVRPEASFLSPGGREHAGVDHQQAEHRVPVTGIRRLTAKNMVASALTVPHATIFLTVDVTRSLRVLDRLRVLPAWRDTRLSPLLLIAKAVLVALPHHPMVNATWAGDEIVVHEYVNLGIAVAAERGLLVPNVKDAHRRSSLDLARETHRLVAAAREGAVTPSDMRGGTFSITNIGVFGVDSGTPLVPVGETAILAVGAIRDAPWVHEGTVTSRKIVTLSLSFDHRVIDGAEGSRFLRDIGDFLTDPGVCLLAWS